MAEIKYHGWTTEDKQITAIMALDGLSMCIEDEMGNESYTLEIEYEELQTLLVFIEKHRLDKK
jgi:hypothetical protein